MINVSDIDARAWIGGERLLREVPQELHVDVVRRHDDGLARKDPLARFLVSDVPRDGRRQLGSSRPLSELERENEELLEGVGVAGDAPLAFEGRLVLEVQAKAAVLDISGALECRLVDHIDELRH
ncbi:hypothetical protein [Pseudoclavibacter helvolus]|uniref:hypothetical protein n=1 Tax=Pseudoclavibacter helvolus TaxID=255205 RepID=UPI0024AD46F7|nr:hypothetical protein [Pseudoclavibacter helvolus]